jgi:CRISPR system Cascade subunit CasB
MTAPRQSRAAAFVAHLHALVKDPERPDRAALAALRRGLGKEPGTVPEMYPHVEPCMAAAPKKKADAAYVVASLFGAHPVPWTQPDDAPRNTSFGWTLRHIRFRDDGGEDEGVARREDEGVARRFVAALNCHREALPTHLRQLFGLLHARAPDAPVDWKRLFEDIVHWEDTDRWVQRRWAEGFWRGEPSAAAREDAAPSSDEDTVEEEPGADEDAGEDS